MSGNEWREEADAFDRRIRERLAAGFVPDLRKAPKCEYFYQSVWRDPHYVRLFWLAGFRSLAELIEKYAPTRRPLSLLDAGCGPGYFALEFYRSGMDVVGIDVSVASIEAARATLAHDDTPAGECGSLRYECLPLERTGEIGRRFDVVLFSGILHHLEDIDGALEVAKGLLEPDGILVCGEPARDSWTEGDAAQVALLRAVLSLSGLWRDTTLGQSIGGDENKLRSLVRDVFDEYVNEKDKDAGAQSPHDNASGGQEILAALRRHFVELELRPGASFIHRMLGGLRGPEEQSHAMADLLAAYDRLAVCEGWIRPTHFLFAGRLA
jgi:2-polyprenyl-3-methyl-5-hydroxy-6-metoxy-1,4-benzoquinol methylase